MCRFTPTLLRTSFQNISGIVIIIKTNKTKKTPKSADKPYLDFFEVNRFSDQLIIFWELLPGGQLDKDLT